MGVIQFPIPMRWISRGGQRVLQIAGISILPDKELVWFDIPEPLGACSECEGSGKDEYGETCMMCEGTGDKYEYKARWWHGQ